MVILGNFVNGFFFFKLQNVERPQNLIASYERKQNSSRSITRIVYVETVIDATAVPQCRRNQPRNPVKTNGGIEIVPIYIMPFRRNQFPDENFTIHHFIWYCNRTVGAHKEGIPGRNVFGVNNYFVSDTNWLFIVCVAPNPPTSFDYSCAFPFTRTLSSPHPLDYF